MIVYADNAPVERNSYSNTIKLFISQPMHGRTVRDILESADKIATKYIEYINPDRVVLKEDDQCVSDGAACIACYSVVLNDEDYDGGIEDLTYVVLNNVYHNPAPEGANERIWMLGESIKMMAHADVIIFAPNARSNSAGVTVEEAVADQYGLKHYFVFDDDPKVYEKFIRTRDVRESYKEV